MNYVQFSSCLDQQIYLLCLRVGAFATALRSADRAVCCALNSSYLISDIPKELCPGRSERVCEGPTRHSRWIVNIGPSCFGLHLCHSPLICWRECSNKCYFIAFGVCVSLKFVSSAYMVHGMWGYFLTNDCRPELLAKHHMQVSLWVRCLET